MNDPKTNWLNNLEHKHSINSISTKSRKSKFYKTTILIFALLLFLFLFSRETQIQEHSFYLDSKTNQVFTEVNSIRTKGLVANREKASFLNLAAGCVAKTEWLAPVEGNPTLEPKADKATIERVQETWASIPPARGDHSISLPSYPNIATLEYAKENNIIYADALALLYQGHNIIWYKPSLLETNPATFTQMQNYITDITTSSKEANIEYYLLPLPEYRLKELPREIYFTKLNYTQSCVKFSEEVL